MNRKYSLGEWYEAVFNTAQKLGLTSNQIVPVMPFALNERLTVPTDNGMSL